MGRWQECNPFLLKFFTEIRSESFFLREVQTWMQKEDVRFMHVVEYTELDYSTLEADWPRPLLFLL